MRLLAIAFLCLALTGCFNRADSLAPVVTITDPPTGTVRRAEGLTVTGYALDDEGIRAIRVNGQDLLANPAYQHDRGNKLVQFGFMATNVQEGQRRFDIEVEDVNGRKTLLRYEIQIDTEPPVIELDPIERLANNRMRVSGLVRDNDRVKRIIVNDVEIPFAPAEQRLFSVVVPSSNQVSVVAYDQAENRAVATAAP